MDAVVEITPKREKAPEQESKEVLEMYKLFVVDDKPEGADPVSPEVIAWKRKKNVLQKLIVEKMGYEEYADILAPELKVEAPKPEVKAPVESRPKPVTARVPTGPAEGLADNPVPELIRQGLPGPEALIPPEGAVTNETQAPQGGFLANLMAKARGLIRK